MFVAADVREALTFSLTLRKENEPPDVGCYEMEEGGQCFVYEGAFILV